ncbi:MAG: response regulator transcription factor [Bacillaceae bacterium]|nr:response regulator transcription factor [Bacillaceae bacterium]
METKGNKVSVLIIDDHKLFREGVKRILEMEDNLTVVGEAADGEEGYRMALEMKPDVILMDINMPHNNGVEATVRIKQELPDTKIIILSIHDDENYVFQTLRSGASGYLLKDVDSDSLVTAVQSTSRGESYVHPKITGKLIDEFRRLSENQDQQQMIAGVVTASQTNVEIYQDDKKFRSLTTREQQVLALMASGYSNRQIGIELSISEKTVKNHVSSILQKLDVQDRLHAVVLSVKNGWVKL